MNAKTEKFLRELAELCRKHGIGIQGCGCCGSPWADAPGEAVDHIRCDETGKFEEDGLEEYSARGGE